MRILYLAGIITLVILSMPVLAVIAFLIIIDSGFPVLFRQRRIGKYNKPFWMYKFRTMHTGAEEKQGEIKRKNEANGPVFKVYNDPRFTGVGRRLAHLGLDELPQLFNVLRGDMALIGPRPLPVYEAKHLRPWQMERHKIKPGIISPWIFEGYHRQTFDAWMKSDIAYSNTKNPIYDIQLFLHAFRLLFVLFAREIFNHHDFKYKN